MIEEEGLGDYFSKAFMLGATFNKRGGNSESAGVWARKGWEVLAWAEEESMEAQKIWDLPNRWGRGEVLGKNNRL